MALYAAAKSLNRDEFPEEDRPGIDILLQACKAPLRRIVENAGCSPDVVERDLEGMTDRSDITSENGGYNAIDDKVVDLVAAGIIDPVKVTRTAFQNAASVASTFLSLDAVIHNVEVGEKNNAI